MHPAPALGPRLGHIKGSAFREFLAYYARTEGRAKLTAHVERLPPELAGQLDTRAEVLGVLASQWYRAELVHALLDEIVLGRSPQQLQDLTRAASRAVMDATLRGLYRLLFEWMATPDRYARYAPKLWRSYYDSGELEIEYTPGKLRAISIVRRWSAHHPVICDLNLGAAPAIYGAMGCRKVQTTRLACVSRGDGECRFVTTWE